MIRRPIRPLSSTLAFLLLGGVVARSEARAQAPDPGGNENAELSEALAGKRFGFNGLFQLEEGRLGEAAALARGAGGNASRTPVHWWGLEPERDRWSEPAWSRHEALYREFVALGIRPHFVIVYAPPWAREPQFESCLTRPFCNFPPAQDELDEWREFMRELATRFPEATIEIWNEPNHAGAWRSGVDPEHYAELLAAAYEAVKSVSPETEVLAAGLGTSIKPGGLDYRTFLDRAYTAEPSLKGHTDAINVHAYPSQNLGANGFLAHWLKDVREVRAAHEDEATPIFVTEVGYTTSGPSAVEELEQAILVRRVTAKLLTMPDVSGVLLHELLERPSHPAEDNQFGYGLLRHAQDGSYEPKLAYCALGRAAAIRYPLCAFRFFFQVDAGTLG